MESPPSSAIICPTARFPAISRAIAQLRGAATAELVGSVADVRSGRDDVVERRHRIGVSLPEKGGRRSSRFHDQSTACGYRATQRSDKM